MLWRLQQKIEKLQIEWGNPIAALSHWQSSFSRDACLTRLGYCFAGLGNAGDHASHLGARHTIGIPGQAFFMSQVNQTLNKQRKSPRIAALCIGGGGLFQPVFANAWQSILKSNIPFIILGVGIAEAPPFRPMLDPSLFKQIAQRSLFTAVRDVKTAELVRKNGGEATVAFCPSLLRVKDYRSKRSEKPDVILNVVHPNDLAFAGVDYFELKEKVVALANKMNLKYFEINHNTPFSHSLMSLYCRASLVVSSRLHGCIFSYALGVPCVPIVCDMKTTAFYDTHTDYQCGDPTESLKYLSSLKTVKVCTPATNLKITEIEKSLSVIGGLSRATIAFAINAN